MIQHMISFACIYTHYSSESLGTALIAAFKSFKYPDAPYSCLNSEPTKPLGIITNR